HPYLSNYLTYLSIPAAWLQELFPTWGSVIGVRLVALLGSLCCFVGLYLLGIQHQNKQFGLQNTLFFIAIPISFYYTQVGEFAIVASGLYLLSLALFTDALKTQSQRSIQLSALLCALLILLNITY